MRSTMLRLVALAITTSVALPPGATAANDGPEFAKFSGPTRAGSPYTSAVCNELPDTGTTIKCTVELTILPRVDLCDLIVSDNVIGDAFYRDERTGFFVDDIPLRGVKVHTTMFVQGFGILVRKGLPGAFRISASFNDLCDKDARTARFVGEVTYL